MPRTCVCSAAVTAYVRLNSEPLSGWPGEGTVVEDQAPDEPLVSCLRDATPRGGEPRGVCPLARAEANRDGNPMMQRLYRAGDHVRLLKPTLSGGQDDMVVIKDQAPEDIYVTLVTDAIILSDLNGYANICQWWELELIAETP